MADYYFISYSSVDGAEFTLQLADALRSGSPSIETWLDKQRLRPGIDWDDQIVEAIRDCKGLLYVMTQDSVRSDSVCKDEWSRALKYKKPIIPLRLHRDAETPFRLGNRQFLDFSDSFDAALDGLRSHLVWVDTPAGVLHSLKSQLSDLERELPRAEPQHRAGIQDAILELRQRIEQQQLLVDDPHAASQRTERRIALALERERQAEPQAVAPTGSKFINPPPAAAPAWFQDRHVETGLIGEFIRDEALRMMIVMGRAGIGKTAMVCRLLKSLEMGRLPNDGEPLQVDGIVYLSAAGSRRVNFSHLFADLCRLLPENTTRMLQAIYQNAQTSTLEKMQALLENFQDRRIIVLLDNFEDTVETQTGEIRDAELDAALRALLQVPQHGVKVIITTRVAPQSLQLFEAGRQTMLELDKGLESPYAENILRAMDRDGKIGLRDAPAELLETARVRTRGYPRALEALFAILSADRDTSLQEILNEAQGLLPENVVQVLVGEAFNRLDPLAQKVMQALAIYGFSVPPTAIDYLLQVHEPGIDSTPILKRLVNMQFARRESGLYYLHHVDRSYALERIPKGQPEDWQTGEGTPFTRHGLWHRGAEYFRKVRRDESTWTSLDDLKPLFAEFELLSASGDFDEALDVLYTMSSFLEREGYYRQIARMAEVLIGQAQEPVRSNAAGLAGWALSSLGEEKAAIELLSEALKLPELDIDLANDWRLELARNFGLLGDYPAAAAVYQKIIETAQEDVEMQVTAQLGLGWLAELQNVNSQAEATYLDALKTYLRSSTMEMSEDGRFRFNPDVLAPEAPFSDPSAWYPIGEISFAEGTDDAIISYLYGIQLEPFSDALPEPGQVSEQEEETEDNLLLVPVLVTFELARIWDSLAAFYEKTDRLVEAYACCRLALSLYDVLEEDTGVAATLEALRRMALQFSDDESQALVEEQERELAYAQASRHRKLEIALMQNLAQSYLERNRLDEAEQFYLDLLQDARELEFSSLGQQAELGLARVDWAREKPEAAVERLLQLLDQSSLNLQLYTDIQALLGRIELDRRHRRTAARYALEASHGYLVLDSPFQHLDMEKLLASISIEKREYEAAVQRLEAVSQQAQALGIPSFLASTLCDLADAYLAAGMQEKALEAANQAYRVASVIKLSALAAQTLMTVGRISAELGKYELSKNSYQQAHALYENIGKVPGQIDVNRGLSWMYYLMEQPEEQIKVARQAWALSQEYGDPAITRDSRMELALALSDNAVYEEAIQHFEAILSETPADALAMVNFGWVLYQAGQYDRSLVESQLALETDPTQTMAIRNLGHAYLAKGLPEQAEREYRRAIQERKGGEHFIETVRVLKKLLSEKPDLPRGKEMLALFEAEQARLDAVKSMPANE